MSNSNGFKVDVRIVQESYASTKQNRESDTDDVRISRKDAFVRKISEEKLKLFIESKWVVDHCPTY